MRKELADRMKQTDALIKEASTFLRINGLDYDLNEWMTVKSYCEKFEIENTQTVSNWISRGIVPPENVKEIKELNDLKLIRAIPYR
jgi:hypothetical protein